MQLPAFILSVLLASTYALAYGLLTGKTGSTLTKYAGFSLVGFFVAFAAASRVHLTSWGLGEIPIVECTLGALACLGLATLLRI